MRMIDDCRYHLVTAGIPMPDADQLRRIAMTLHRWHELECGDSNNWCSTCLVRGHEVNGEFTYDDNGKPYNEVHHHAGNAKASYYRVPDRERGALKRLSKIMARYPQFTFYVQGDPRGAPLYIVPIADIPAECGANWLEANYNHGIAVYR